MAKRIGSAANLDYLSPKHLSRLGADSAAVLRSARAKYGRGVARQDAEERPDAADIAALGGATDKSPGIGAGIADLPTVVDAAMSHERMAELLADGSPPERRDAMRVLLLVKPGGVANTATRQQIARGFRDIAIDETGVDQGRAIRGLVIWGGKHSVPILIELMDKEKLRVSDELFTALVQLQDPRGAEAVARQLGNFFNHEAAVAALRRMGPAAEDALIKAAPSNNADVSLAAIQLLGEAGTDKCLELLRKAATSRNPDVREAAKTAIKAVRERAKKVAP